MIVCTPCKNHDKRRAIVIAGEWHSSNLGDEIICKTFQYLLTECAQSEQYYCIALDISKCRMYWWKKALRYVIRCLNSSLAESYDSSIRARMVRWEVRRLFVEHDVYRVLIPGGAQFQRYFAKPLWALVRECATRNVSVFFNACGYGPNNIKSEAIFRRIFTQSCVKRITTRDDISAI